MYYIYRTMAPKRTAVREPLQVYVDRDDRELLEAVVARTGLTRAEVLRRGLRAYAGQVLTERGPGASLETLIGVLEDAPQDLSARHDEYLVEYADRPRRPHGRPRRR